MWKEKKYWWVSVTRWNILKTVKEDYKKIKRGMSEGDLVILYQANVEGKSVHEIHALGVVTDINVQEDKYRIEIKKKIGKPVHLHNLTEKMPNFFSPNPIHCLSIEKLKVVFETIIETNSDDKELFRYIEGNLPSGVNIPLTEERIANSTNDLPRRRYRKPQVLLIGNGIDMLFGAPSWDKLLRHNYDMKGITNIFNLSAPLKYQALCGNNEERTRHDLQEYLIDRDEAMFSEYLSSVDVCAKKVVQDILSLEVAAIITTNYTHLLERVSESYEETPYVVGDTVSKHVVCKELHNNGKNVKLYHIHGDIDNATSMVLSHSDYANCLAERVRERNNDYSLAALLLEADIHVVGHSLYGDEMDLWWLFEEKAHTYNGSTVYWYTHNFENATEKTTMEFKRERDYANARKWLISHSCGTTEPMEFVKRSVQADKPFYCREQGNRNIAKDYADFYAAALRKIAIRISRA